MALFVMFYLFGATIVIVGIGYAIYDAAALGVLISSTGIVAIAVVFAADEIGTVVRSTGARLSSDIDELSTKLASAFRDSRSDVVQDHEEIEKAIIAAILAINVTPFASGEQKDDYELDQLQDRNYRYALRSYRKVLQSLGLYLHWLRDDPL
jgi:hypothetical protein